MDSGNSGSLQSSSGGGDQEYADSISRPNSMIYNSNSLQSSMINPSFVRYNNNNYNSVSVPSPSSMFNSPSEYLNMFSQSSLNQNQNSLINQDVLWSRDPQLDQPSYTTLINQNPLGSSLPMSQNNHSRNILASQAQIHDQSQPQGSAMLSRNNENGSRIMKSSKKRTRASRRAPTTVLTTDTSNFRAMVQEFTGIPAPPFSTAPLSFSRRFDLFGSGSSSLIPLRPNNNISSSLGSSNAATAAATTTTNNNNLNNSNYEPLLNITQRDPMRTFHSLLQPNARGFTNQINYTETTGFGTKDGQRGSSSTMVARNDEQGVRNENMNQQITQEKAGLEIVPKHGSSRGVELGTADSWICQSD